MQSNKMTTQVIEYHLGDAAEVTKMDDGFVRVEIRTPQCTLLGTTPAGLELLIKAARRALADFSPRNPFSED